MSQTKWTDEKFKNAQRHHQYIKIGPTAGFLLLSGAPGKWKKGSDDIYVPSLRVVGSRADVRQLLASRGVSPSQTGDYLASAYTRDNYNTTHRAEFDAEVAQYKAYKKVRDAERERRAASGLTLAQLRGLAEQIKEARPYTESTGTRSPRGGKRTGRTRPLADRVNSAREKGKVLDVSNMGPNMTNIKMIAVPGGNSKKKGVEGLPVVSSDAANYAQVVRALAGTDPSVDAEAYIARYNEVVSQGSALPRSRGRRASPRLPPPTSQARSGGASLSPMGSPLRR